MNVHVAICQSEETSVLGVFAVRADAVRACVKNLESEMLVLEGSWTDEQVETASVALAAQLDVDFWGGDARASLDVTSTVWLIQEAKLS